MAATDAVASGPADTSSAVDCEGAVGTCSGGLRMSHITVL
jgi:hypothetical protein